MFSKRHYEWLARAFVYAASDAAILNRHEELVPGIRFAAHVLANNMKIIEPNFKKVMFLKACGISDEE